MVGAMLWLSDLIAAPRCSTSTDAISTATVRFYAIMLGTYVAALLVIRLVAMGTYIYLCNVYTISQAPRPTRVSCPNSYNRGIRVDGLQQLLPELGCQGCHPLISPSLWLVFREFGAVRIPVGLQCVHGLGHYQPCHMPACAHWSCRNRCGYRPNDVVRDQAV